MIFGGMRFTAVDIGSYSLKVVRMKKKKGELSILATEMRQLPFGTIKSGRIEDPSIIVSKLEDIFQKMNYRPNKIVTTIPSNSLITRNLELPVMAEDELAEAIKWEAGDYLPFSVDNAKLDWIILNQDEEKMDILLVAVKREVIDNFLVPFKRLALSPAVVNIQPMALLSLLTYQGKLTGPAAIIDMGAESTRVIIGEQKNIYLVRTIDTGGEEFTRSLMEEKGLGFQGAEEYKMKNGIEKIEGDDQNPDYDLDLIQLASTNFGNSGFLLTLASNLAEEISRSLDFFAMKNRGRSITDLYITGGGSKLKGLVDFLSHKLNLELIPLDSFKGLNYQSADQKEGVVNFAVAVGLGVSEVLVDEG